MKGLIYPFLITILKANDLISLGGRKDSLWPRAGYSGPGAVYIYNSFLLPSLILRKFN